MRPTPFAYHRAQSVDEALALLRAAEAVPLAGGQALLKDLRARVREVRSVVDIARIAELQLIEGNGGELATGAAVSLSAALAHPAVARHAALHQALQRVGDTQVRNRASVAGNLFGGGTSDLAVVLLAGRARVRVRDTAGESVLDAASALGAILHGWPRGSLITSVHWPLPLASHYIKLSRRTVDPAMAACCACRFADGTLTLAFGSVHTAIVDASALCPRTAADAGAFEHTIDALAASLAPPDSAHAGPDYRRRMLAVLGRRALDAIDAWPPA